MPATGPAPILAAEAARRTGWRALSSQAVTTGAAAREARLDFFRGIAMFIIFIAHLPLNPWNDYIPARFGPSDATEMFVFCSGFASAIAFGGSFRRHGFAIGTLRIAASLLAGLLVASRPVPDRGRHRGAWAPGGPAASTMSRRSTCSISSPSRRQGIAGLVTLTYVPNYFDILPMYIVVLAMVPAVMALARLGPPMALAGCVTLYLAQLAFDWDLPAEWWSDRPWFFDPFGWQLIFFTGFAFGSGWLPEPPRRRALFWAGPAVRAGDGAAQLAAACGRAGNGSTSSASCSCRSRTRPTSASCATCTSWRWPTSPCGVVNPYRHALSGRWAAPIVLVGQQALPVFLWSMSLAFALGMVLDALGRSWLTVGLANLGGFASLVAVAALARLMRAQPWRQREGRVRQRPCLCRAGAGTGRVSGRPPFGGAHGPHGRCRTLCRALFAARQQEIEPRVPPWRASDFADEVNGEELFVAHAGPEVVGFCRCGGPRPSCTSCMWRRPGVAAASAASCWRRHAPRSTGRSSSSA